MAKIAVAIVLAPTTRVRTARAMLTVNTLPGGMGLLANVWAMEEVRMYRAKASVPEISEPVKHRRGEDDPALALLSVKLWLGGLGAGVGVAISTGKE
jgi:hypothetical protein